MKTAVGWAVVAVGLALAAPVRAEGTAEDGALRLAGLFTDTKLTREVSASAKEAMAKAVMRGNPTLLPAAEPVVKREIDLAFAETLKRQQAFVAGRIKERMSKEEIAAAVDFYGSPAGRHMVDVMNVIAVELPSFTQGESKALTASLAKNIREKLVAAGYLDKNAPLKFGP